MSEMLQKIKVLIKWTGLAFFVSSFFSCAQIKKINSGTTQIKHNFSKAIFNRDLYENKRSWRNISASIRKMRHYSERDDWGLSFKISPSIHLDRVTFQTGATRPNAQGVAVTQPNIDYQRLAVMGNFKIHKATPIGEFSYTLGLGPGVYHVSDGNSLDSLRLRSVIKLDLAYSFFLTKRLFVLVGPRLYFEEGVEILQQAFRIGYYWGKVNGAK